jgi:hypothetical protein
MKLHFKTPSVECWQAIFRALLLVLLKFNAGRQKDLDDIVFLLKQSKLVDRPTVNEKMIATVGDGGWLVMMPGFRRLCDLADGNTKEPGKYDVELSE